MTKPTEAQAMRALHDLLWELPAEFGMDPETCETTRESFKVVKPSNVRKVHRALYDLQVYFGMEG